MNNYELRKERYRNQAIEFSHSERDDWSYLELVEIQNYFKKIGKRYGLLKEFRENAIC